METTMWNYTKPINDLQKQIKWITDAMRRITLAEASLPDLTEAPTLYARFGLPQDQVLEVRAQFLARHAQMIEKMSELSIRYSQVANDLQRCLDDCHDCLTMMESKGFLEKNNRFSLIPDLRRSGQRCQKY